MSACTPEEVYIFPYTQDGIDREYMITPDLTFSPTDEEIEWAVKWLCNPLDDRPGWDAYHERYSETFKESCSIDEPQSRSSEEL